MAASNFSEIVIFTTNLDTDIKMTTLWHDPGMRASMTLNGYKQSHMPLEYIGAESNLTENRRHLKEYHKLRAEKYLLKHLHQQLNTQAALHQQLQTT